MIFNALNWDARDIDHSYTIRIFGRSEDGKSVSVITKFEPYVLQFYFSGFVLSSMFMHDTGTSSSGLRLTSPTTRVHS